MHPSSWRARCKRRCMCVYVSAHAESLVLESFRIYLSDASNVLSFPLELYFVVLVRQVLDFLDVWHIGPCCPRVEILFR